MAKPKYKWQCPIFWCNINAYIVMSLGFVRVGFVSPTNCGEPRLVDIKTVVIPLHKYHSTVWNFLAGVFSQKSEPDWNY